MLQIPTITGLVPYPVEQAIRRTVDYGNQLESSLAIAQADIRAQAARTLTLDEIRAALGATGLTPLNIFQLLGSDAGGVTKIGTHAERVATNAARSGVGALFYETDRAALYTAAIVSAVTVWLLIAQTKPFPGTLSPDLKPADLGVNDSGFEFASTDFDRLYTWSGTAWGDSPGQDPRGRIEFFASSIHANFVPAAGWVLCDGTAGVASSSPTGTIVTITVPDLTTDNRYLRSVAGATGGTTGAATHAHTGTTSDPSGTTEVQSGTGTDVASESHNHTFTTDAASSLPPSYDVRPYFRV